MNKQEQNLRFLRKSIYILKININSNREIFAESTTEKDFGKFCNEKVAEIITALLEFKLVLEKLIDGLSSEIKRLKFERSEK